MQRPLSGLKLLRTLFHILLERPMFGCSFWFDFWKLLIVSLFFIWKLCLYRIVCFHPITESIQLYMIWTSKWMLDICRLRCWAALSALTICACLLHPSHSNRVPGYYGWFLVTFQYNILKISYCSIVKWKCFLFTQARQGLEGEMGVDANSTYASFIWNSPEPMTQSKSNHIPTLNSRA